jgi:cystathionine beta-lyase
MATTTFELSYETLRSRRGSKWNLYPKDVIPAWVADMDFRVPEPVREAMQRLVDDSDFGYPWRTGDDTLATAFQERMRDRFGWEIDIQRVRTVTELVQCMFATALAYSAPGDGIVLQTPIYPPFLNTIAKTERRLVENRWKDDGSRFVLDVENLRAVVDDRTRLLFLCNPHNPTGRVFERDELLALGNLCVERDIVIVVDEIHADLVYAGHQHIPIASLSPEIAARTVTITSATKGFNIAGLRTAVMYFGSAELEEQFNRAVPQTLMGQAGITGIDATIAAWRYGQPWLDDVMQRLTSNRDLVADFVAREMPGIVHHKPESTYLAWLDCRDLDLPGESPQKFFLERAKVGLNDGGTFGEAGRTCVRLNFATSEEVLTQVLERMAEVLPR